MSGARPLPTHKCVKPNCHIALKLGCLCVHTGKFGFLRLRRQVGLPASHAGQFGFLHRHTGKSGFLHRHTGKSGSLHRHTGKSGFLLPRQGQFGFLHRHTGKSGFLLPRQGQSGSLHRHTGKSGFLRLRRRDRDEWAYCPLITISPLASPSASALSTIFPAWPALALTITWQSPLKALRCLAWKGS